MIDLETMGVEPDAVIVAIGAVRFSQQEVTPLNRLVLHGLYVSVDWQHQPGRHLDGETVKWWLDQQAVNFDLANTILRSGEPRHELPVALTRLRDYIGGCDCFWSRGANFDLPILRHAYEANRPGSTIWKHKAERDVRTVLDLVRISETENPRKHDPLYDAAVQAYDVQRAYATLRWAFSGAENWGEPQPEETQAL